MTTTQVKRGYASVNNLDMYYEIHGAGEPLLLLHGQFASIEMFSKILPALAQSRRVVAVEQQGHGRTADIDRPLRFEQMADDTAALLEQIGIDTADVYGYSTGGWVALQLAVRHPAMVASGGHWLRRPASRHVPSVDLPRPNSHRSPPRRWSWRQKTMSSARNTRANWLDCCGRSW